MAGWSRKETQETFLAIFPDFDMEKVRGRLILPPNPLGCGVLEEF
jgi:hypothetical protein